jgi:hypothetical protein
MGVRIEGLDQLERNLRDLSQRARRLNGRHEIPISDLLSVQFLSRCSRFSSAQELFAASGYEINSQSDFDAIPSKEWDLFIGGNTSFDDWQSMLQAAAGDWAKKQLRLKP